MLQEPETFKNFINNESKSVSGNKIRVLVDEEQEFLRDAYRLLLPVESNIEVVDVTNGGIVKGEMDSLVKLVEFDPNVLLISTRMLQPSLIAQLELIHENYADIGFVLLVANYNTNGVKLLREFLKRNPVRGAYMLKYSVNSISELARIIYSVNEGRLVVDPAVMGGIVSDEGSQSLLLKELTRREVEILSWIAKGYRNSTICGVLGLELKTVEHHINSIFSKLNHMVPESKHTRVQSVLLYLKATGRLLPEIQEEGE